MLSFLLAIHFVLALLIIVLVLLQKHEADGVLGTGSGGANKVFSIRGQANILTRSTAVLMTIFFINCLIMAKMVKHTPSRVSIIDKVASESVPLADGATDQTPGSADADSAQDQEKATQSDSNGAVAPAAQNTATPVQSPVTAPVAPSVPPTKPLTAVPPKKK